MGVALNESQLFFWVTTLPKWHSPQRLQHWTLIGRIDVWPGCDYYLRWAPLMTEVSNNIVSKERWRIHDAGVAWDDLGTSGHKRV